LSITFSLLHKLGETRIGPLQTICSPPAPTTPSAFPILADLELVYEQPGARTP
jgi:hypothetical protein